MNTFWIMLGCLGPLFLLAGVARVWRWRLDRRKERVPVSEQLLRPAGESLRKKVEELQDELSEKLAFLLAVPLACAVTGLAVQNRDSRTWWGVGSLGAVVTLWL